MPRSDPQIPDSRVLSRAHPGRSTFGSAIVISRSGAAYPDRMPGIRPPTTRPAAVRGSERNISSASIIGFHLQG